MSERHLIVVDCETTGLNHDRHVAIEIAAIDTVTGEELYIAPRVKLEAWIDADPVALSINKYFERRVFERTNIQDELAKAVRLADMLAGNTFGGSNPTFDVAMVGKYFRQLERTDPRADGVVLELGHHHRLADLAAYAAGVLGLPPNALPGLAAVQKALAVPDSPDHSALGDARVTAQCFSTLAQIAAGRKS